MRSAGLLLGRVGRRPLGGPHRRVAARVADRHVARQRHGRHAGDGRQIVAQSLEELDAPLLRPGTVLDDLRRSAGAGRRSPGSVAASRARLRISSPAPTSRTSDTATWPTTSALRSRVPPLESVARAAGRQIARQTRRRGAKGGCDAEQNPVSNRDRPARIAGPASPGPWARSPRSARPVAIGSSRWSQNGERHPEPGPRHTASATLSISSLRRRSARGRRPSAARTANSERRAAPRASSRPATLAQAISRTSPTAPIRTSSRGVCPLEERRLERIEAQRLASCWSPDTPAADASR